jgi:hypothetical protein
MPVHFGQSLLRQTRAHPSLFSCQRLAINRSESSVMCGDPAHIHSGRDNNDFIGASDYIGSRLLSSTAVPALDMGGVKRNSRLS